MKILKFFARHKIFTGFLILSFLITASCITFSSYYAIGVNLEVADLISITFDKRDMMSVNKVEIETPKGTTIIENQELIQDIVKSTLVAKNSGFSSMLGYYSIRLYKDDILIRDMDLSLYNNLILVYHSDGKHWILLGEGDDGYVCISQELLDRVQQYLLERGNSFGEADGTYWVDGVRYKYVDGKTVKIDDP